VLGRKNRAGSDSQFSVADPISLEMPYAAQMNFPLVGRGDAGQGLKARLPARSGNYVCIASVCEPQHFIREGVADLCSFFPSSLPRIPDRSPTEVAGSRSACLRYATA